MFSVDVHLYVRDVVMDLLFRHLRELLGISFVLFQYLPHGVTPYKVALSEVSHACWMDLPVITPPVRSLAIFDKTFID